MIRASNILTILQIILLVVFGYSCNAVLQTINFENKEDNNLYITLISLVFSILLGIHFLKIIVNLDMSKYYNSEIITNYERK